MDLAALAYLNSMHHMHVDARKTGHIALKE